MTTAIRHSICLINGTLSEPLLSVYDLGFIRGYSAFEYLRTYRGLPFRLKDHLDRLENSVREIGLDLPRSLDEIAADIKRAILLGNFTEAGIKIFVTGGASADQFSYEGKPALIVLAYPHVPCPDDMYENGLKLITYPFERPFCESKTSFYLPAVRAMGLAQARGADDALFIGQGGELLETGTANFFGVKRGEIYTAPSGVLKGITRKVVLEIAPIKEAFLFTRDIPQFEGAFLTASNKEVMPVTEIDGFSIPISAEVRSVMQAFTKYIKNF